MSKRSAKVKIIFGLVLLFLIVTRTSLARVPQVLHVLIVLEENTDYADVCGPNHISMPFLCGLKSQGSFSANYYAPTHPSIGNYNDLGWGVITTNNDGCVPTSCGFPYTGDNIVRELNAVGKTWKGYAESLPSTCYLGGDSGQYAVRHSPIPYISDVQSNCLNGYVAFEDPNLGFAHDLAANTLPNYAFITPNLCDDAHDCTLPGSLIPDQWVQNNVIQPLLNGGMVVPGQRLRWISPPPGRPDGTHKVTVADCSACSAGDHRCGQTAASASDAGTCDADGCAGCWMLRSCQRHNQLWRRNATKHVHLDSDGDVRNRLERASPLHHGKRNR